MQQTKFDQWLKEKFLYETHVFTMRLPEDELKRGVVITNIESENKGAYRYKLVMKSRKRAEEVIAVLKENHLMHATHVVEAKYWYARFIAPPGGSFTYRWILRFIGLVCLVGFVWTAITLLENADLVKSVKEAIKQFE